MRKALLFGTLSLLLLAGCSSKPAGVPTPATLTPTLVITEAPEALPTPTVTSAPADTPLPTVTSKATPSPKITAASEPAVPTATPAPTVTPQPTATPKPTKAPTATPAPTVTPQPTATPEPTKAPTAPPLPTKAPTKAPTPTKATEPAKPSGDLTYNFHDMTYATSYGTKYDIQTDGSIKLEFEKQYQEIKLSLPQDIDMNYCTEVTMKAKSEFSEISIKLYDENFNELFVKYDCKGNGVVDYTLTPNLSTKVSGIGIMALNVVEDYSKYQATVYSLTFHMEPGYDDSGKTPDTGLSNDATLLETYGTVFEHIGTCINLWQLQNTSTLNIVKSQYNSVTSENEMKPDALLGASPNLISVEEAKNLGYVIPENYTDTCVPRLNFSSVDKILELCAKNGLRYRAHTLVWHSQTPNWFFRSGFSGSGALVTPEVMNARMEFYIRSVMTHVYNNPNGHVVYAWDVVNEYLNADSSNWIAVYGGKNLTPSFVKLAFEIADNVLQSYGIRENVSLIFNDYNTYMNTNKIISIVKFINSEQRLCDGFGMQAHLDTGFPTTAAFKNTVNSFLATGLEVQITELDVTTKSASTQEQYYYSLMTGLLEIKKNGGKLTGITYWGLGDSNSWRKSQTPLLFSAPGKPKNAYYKVLQAFTDAGYSID